MMNKVLFEGNKVFIGAEHGKPISLSEADKKKVKAVAGKHGVWYEGAGGDVEPSADLFSPEEYEGSWDDEFADSVQGYPYEFLYTIFTNTAVNKQAKALTAPSKTIFASIMDGQKKVGYFKDRKFGENTLRKFLKSCASVGIDLLAMSQKKATADNVAHFLKAGERLMWPSNWSEYPNAAGKAMKKAEEARIKFLKSAASGVYIVGKDHLKFLVDTTS
jgi:hypothetical protein